MTHRAVLAALWLLAGTGAGLAQTAPAAEPAATAEAPTAPVVPDLPPPADCTFTKVFICEAAAGCGPLKELGTIDLPARMLVHYPRRIIASVSDDGLPHVSEIVSVSSAGDNITLQGMDGLLGWVMQLSRSQPGVTLTTVSNDKVLTSFGTCKPAP